MSTVAKKESNVDLVDKRFYERWARIYAEKGRADGWPAAREWARRTFDNPMLERLREEINRQWGIKK